MCGDEDIIRKFMLSAYDNGMTSGDFVFISLTLLPSERVKTPWVRHDVRDDDAMRAYQPLLEVPADQLICETQNRSFSEYIYTVAEKVSHYEIKRRT